MENSSFITFDNEKSGLLYSDIGHKNYPIRYFNVTERQYDFHSPSSSFYIFVYVGSFVVTSEDGVYQLLEGQYASLHSRKPVSFNSLCNGSKAIVVEVLHDRGIYPETKFKCMNMVGGPIEKEGRLSYIDGCTDSILIHPVKLGNPCLNHLHFPAGIDQTQHTHPSHRIGIVHKGDGLCITPFGNLPLKTGMIFIIKEWDGETYSSNVGSDTEFPEGDYPVGQHAFRTFETEMDVIAFHPDSDFGATDVNHPMINKTIVNGVSASLIDSIRTKK